MMLKLFIGLSVLSFLAAGPGSARAEKLIAGDTGALKKKLQAELDAWHKGAKFAGATVGVTFADGRSFGLSTGYSDRVKKTPMRPSDLMPAGSVGKTYAAAVALQLVGEGKIGLDEPVSKYLGREEWFERLPNAREMTVRQLMNHTSGLVRYEFNPEFIKDLLADPYKVWRPEEQVAYLFGSKAPFEAGKGWEYSDTNYIVLGMIIEKVTGKSYYELAEERLLEPLKLNRTKPQTGPSIKGMVQGYAGERNPFGGTDEMLREGRMVFNPAFEWTGGGMVSNGRDLARWAHALYRGRAFDKSLMTPMLEGVPAPMLGKDVRYGLGVIIRPTPQGTTWGHSGFFPGYFTDMMYFPETGTAVAVQVNSSVPPDIGRPLGRLLPALHALIQETSKETSKKTKKR